MSITRWQYRNTSDLITPHASTSDNTTSVTTDPNQIEFRYLNSAGTEFKWHRPATNGDTLVGKTVFPAEISDQDVSKLSQVKIYLKYAPMSAYKDGATHVICDIKSNRAITGLELICGFLIQADDKGGVLYGNNQGLQWDVYREPISLTSGVQTFIRALPPEHLKKQSDAQLFQPRHRAFYYWRMEGANTFRPGDEIEFSFRFVSQPFIEAPVGVRSS